MIGNTRSPVLFKIRPLMTNSDGGFLGVPPYMATQTPMPAVSATITGVSRDSTGAALGGCTCTLFKVNTQDVNPMFVQYAVTVSDGSGNYSFNVGFDGPYRVTFDLAGAPIRAGLTLRTLSGA